MGRRRFEYSVEGEVSPQRFIRALTDMSDERPRYWPGQTHNQYRVLQTGRDWALIQEGTGTAWERSRYDWSRPGTVVSTVEESNFLKPGTRWEFRVRKHGDGCRVDVVLEREFTGIQGLAVQALSYLPGANAGFALVLRRTMGILEREAAEERPRRRAAGD